MEVPLIIRPRSMIYTHYHKPQIPCPIIIYAYILLILHYLLRIYLDKVYGIKLGDMKLSEYLHILNP